MHIYIFHFDDLYRLKRKKKSIGLLNVKNKLMLNFIEKQQEQTNNNI